MEGGIEPDILGAGRLGEAGLEPDILGETGVAEAIVFEAREGGAPGAGIPETGLAMGWLEATSLFCCSFSWRLTSTRAISSS
jgi:hypothetical protein